MKVDEGKDFKKDSFMMPNNSRIDNPALRLAKYLKEFVGLRTTTVRDVTKYDSVLWFHEMPQENDCKCGAWLDDYDPAEPWLTVKKQRFEKAPKISEQIVPWVDGKAFS